MNTKMNDEPVAVDTVSQETTCLAVFPPLGVHGDGPFVGISLLHGPTA